MNTYDVFDFLVEAEFSKWGMIKDEFAGEERISYDGPRQTEINIPLCLHLMVYTRS